MEHKLLILINRDWTGPLLDRVMAIFSSINFWAVPLIMLVAAVAIWGGFRARAMLLVLALSLVVSDSIVGNTLKQLIRRPRPNEVEADVRIVSLNLHRPFQRLRETLSGQPANPPWIHVAFSRPDPDAARGRSFPSDHTLNNFCAAVIIACFYRRLGWLAFFPAALVGYSRIYVGSHWPSDVAISVVMAVGMSLLLLALYELLWRKFGPRLLPRLHECHPSLWEPAITEPAP